ncbi:H/ACA ribonucleoprotein complex subunit 1 [Galdieria sulphuraria]|uniref:H/ACA ribonucleoprotein complex subunit n=1 Tax=Galdieria sulphuraria TaxID=130081 RepID=M2VWP1_GALSU|nr:H/ACA ribonucleoprotein complex subunit 1 [Galdieria sulphuraria]EME27666.1 H/ACA ribonucleoprotein complex subunit 1 [Galdieria sulphuraria]|eukprot:XP_005704186.1 H/ACA ribonucleoprotein complex subunit 1 [Galdieria sulphuraria]
MCNSPYLFVMASWGGFRGGRSRGRFSREPNNHRFGSSYSNETPSQLVEMGIFQHPCENELVCKSTNEKIPFFNAPIFLENKTQIGKVEEIFGPITDVHFTIKPVEGVLATSFGIGEKFFIGTEKLLPLERFLPKPPGSSSGSKSGRTPQGIRKPSAFGRGGRGGGRGRGGGGGMGRGRGNFRGSSPFHRGGRGRRN